MVTKIDASLQPISGGRQRIARFLPADLANFHTCFSCRITHSSFFFIRRPRLRTRSATHVDPFRDCGRLRLLALTPVDAAMDGGGNGNSSLTYEYSFPSFSSYWMRRLDFPAEWVGSKLLRRVGGP
ncbi:hypothetical protein E2C01_043882 [Portunus trituberculatus]|uniref:Uncharacterized protein n=1 Tax=Portunus trituberculatus TaxID=210409 RepID=A0A5B7FQL0_PORTR|nr:hypothetical protein [Portunus trituberculatus]